MRLDEFVSTKVSAFATELANHYGGRADWRYPRVWSRSIGGRYRDPEHWVKFNTPEALEAAWTDLQSKGKVMYIRDRDYPSEKPDPYVRIGKFIIGKARESLFVQTVSIMRNYLRKQEAEPVKEAQVNEISLKTKVNAYSSAKDPDFDYVADQHSNPKRKFAQADRLRAAIARKHGEEAASQADDQAAYDHYGDSAFVKKQVPPHVKQREPVTELSDKRLKKYVKKATKSADALQYYSDSRNDPDWDKAQKRKKMVDVAKKKLGEGGMPASIIKAKQAYASKSPEELLAAFKEVSERTGKSIQVLAYAAAMRHGYTDINTYWKRIQGLV